MHIKHQLEDQRIGATNYLLEFSVGEYLELARHIINQNEFQRRRVKSSTTIYSLLKDDLRRGCVILPIVLAHTSTEDDSLPNDSALLQKLSNDPSRFVILDGLQRTHTLIELVNEIQEGIDSEKTLEELQQVKSLKIRVEVYVGISRLGILYRMLTLNTGQTPMSLRQQIEILYIDYLKNELENIKLIRESDGENPKTIGEYAFKSVVEGFNSYIERNELPIDRYDLLESIKSLETLSKEDRDTNLFEAFITTYDLFIRKYTGLCDSSIARPDELGIKGQPFGKDVKSVFTKTQAICGFGASIGRLVDKKAISDFNEVRHLIESLEGDSCSTSSLEHMLQRLEDIRLNSKKIGTSQRQFFNYFFRELFNKDSDSFKNIDLAVETAYRITE